MGNGKFFNNSLAVKCFSFDTAIIECLSLSENDIFDDVRYCTIMMLQCLTGFSNFFSTLNYRDGLFKNYETVSKFVKVMPVVLWSLFSRTWCIFTILLLV